ncbi:MAG: LysM peptidoglycan-binding domain-containing protein [Bacteroidales bacterium]|nr:LysM peptidoglycan-binding domain-containing protein [Bacteroidales bacterium]
MLLIVLVPILLAGLVFYGTKDLTKYYISTATIYTGLGSGLSLESEANARLDYFGSKMEFDNIINLFKARETQEEVALSLFIQGLSLKTWDPQYISKESFKQLQELVPQYIKNMIVLPNKSSNDFKRTQIPLILNDTVGLQDKQIRIKNKYYLVQSNESLFSISSKLGVSASDLMNKNTITSTNLQTGDSLIYEQEELLVYKKPDQSLDTIPLYIPDPNYYLKAEIDSISFVQTLKKFKKYYADNDTNYLYGLLNYEHKYYSMKAIDKVEARRIQGSDLIELSFKTSDPGICKQTLNFSIDAFKRNYKKLKENQSDNVVAYFEERVAETSINLQAAENRLLKFNQDNNIINYYEQTRHISEQKQILESRYYDELMLFTAADSALKKLDQQLANQKGIARLNTEMLGYRNQISDITYKIAVNELNDSPDPKTIKAIESLKMEQANLRDKINRNIDSVFGMQFSAQGVSSNEMLTQWLNNLLIYEETKAKIAALGERRSEFQRTYEQFAPLGAKLSRIEREINVYEQQYLSVLNSLNLAKLKQQNLDLQSNIKTVDSPYFPLAAESTKRKIFVAAAFIAGLMMVLFVILVLEYFDNTIKTPFRAEKLSGLELLTAYPRFTKKTYGVDYEFISNRLIEQAIQKLRSIQEKENLQKKKPVKLLFFSTQSTDGKSFLQSAINKKLNDYGYNTLSANYRLPNYKPAFSYIAPEKPIEYTIDHDTFNKKNINEIIDLDKESADLDFILIEIPSITHYAFPPSIIKDIDIAIMVVRSNRSWSKADKNSLNGIKQFLKSEPFVLLNGANAESLETILGELPRKRSKMRRLFKRIIQLQFFESESLNS